MEGEEVHDSKAGVSEFVAGGNIVEAAIVGLSVRMLHRTVIAPSAAVSVNGVPGSLSLHAQKVATLVVGVHLSLILVGTVNVELSKEHAVMSGAVVRAASAAAVREALLTGMLLEDPNIQ